jgi:hypothetical protein
MKNCWKWCKVMQLSVAPPQGKARASMRHVAGERQGACVGKLHAVTRLAYPVPRQKPSSKVVERPQVQNGGVADTLLVLLFDINSVSKGATPPCLSVNKNSSESKLLGN